LQADPFDLGDKKPKAEQMIGERIEPLAKYFWQQHFDPEKYNLIWQEPSLSWPRLFTGVFAFSVTQT
jgi:hypothetical protein